MSNTSKQENLFTTLEAGDIFYCETHLSFVMLIAKRGIEWDVMYYDFDDGLYTNSTFTIEPTPKEWRRYERNFESFWGLSR